MGVEFIYPEFEVIRNTNRCIACRVCERQCANEVHIYDDENKVMLADESKCVNCQRCVSLCPTRALKIVKSDCRLRENANWTDGTIKEIYKQANSGGVLLSSMGNPNSFPVYWDKILINASQVTNPSIDPLREPMEEKVVTISRANGSMSFPANFTLIAAMNPCPCGYYGDEKHACRCSEIARKRYIAKLSGPILDRIDISIEVRAVDYNKIISKADGESSASMRKIVIEARKKQEKRFKENGLKIFSNSAMGIKDTEKFCKMDDKARNLLNIAMERFSMSARSYDKILKVSRTIADLEDKDIIEVNHITEALQYRFNIN